MTTTALDVLYLKNGGRWEFWARYHDLTATFIKAKELTPIQVVGERTVGVGAAAGAGMEVHAAEVRSAGVLRAPIIWGGTHGGMRGPHLHFNGETYLLSAKQWHEFSEQALGKFKEKLNSAHQVSFTQLMELSDAVEAL